MEGGGGFRPSFAGELVAASGVSDGGDGIAEDGAGKAVGEDDDGVFHGYISLKKTMIFRAIERRRRWRKDGGGRAVDVRMMMEWAKRRRVLSDSVGDMCGGISGLNLFLGLSCGGWTAEVEEGFVKVREGVPAVVDGVMATWRVFFAGEGEVPCGAGVSGAPEFPWQRLAGLLAEAFEDGSIEVRSLNPDEVGWEVAEEA